MTAPFDRLVKRSQLLVGAIMAAQSVLIVTLAVAVTFLLVGTSSQADQSRRQARATHALVIEVHQAQLSACQRVGNALRGQEVALWDHLLAVAPPPKGKAAARAARRLRSKFRRYVARTFAPVNCKKIYKLKR